MPAVDVVCDMHCVTHWSRLDNTFTGVPTKAIIERAKPKPNARFVMCHSEAGFTVNVPLDGVHRATTASSRTQWDGKDLDARPRLAAARAGAAAVPVEEREVDPRHRAPRHRRARVLGAERLPHARRPVDGGAVRVVRARTCRLEQQMWRSQAFLQDRIWTTYVSLALPTWPHDSAWKLSAVRPPGVAKGRLPAAVKPSVRRQCGFREGQSRPSPRSRALDVVIVPPPTACARRACEGGRNGVADAAVHRELRPGPASPVPTNSCVWDSGPMCG